MTKVFQQSPDPHHPLLRCQLEFGAVCDQTPLVFIFLAFALDADVRAPEGKGEASNTVTPDTTHLFSSPLGSPHHFVAYADD
jgi:hypothetical protein